MKKILVVASLLVATLCAQAQDIFDSRENKAYFGARISYELACPGDFKINSTLKADILNNGSGLSFGGIYHMPVWKNLYFDPGFSFYYNTYALNQALIKEELENILGQPIRGGFDHASIRQFGIRIPINVGYHFDVLPDLRISVFTGPEVNLGFSADAYITINNFHTSGSVYGKEGLLNRCDIKWRFGVGATFMHHYYAAISGAAGMCDLAKDKLSMHSNLFDITLGYNF